MKQISVNLRRIHSFGVKKISITALGPLQCVPEITALTDFKECNSTLSQLVDFHNFLLTRAVDELNKETNDYPFFILNLHDAFSSVIQNKGNPQGKLYNSLLFSLFHPTLNHIHLENSSKLI